MNQVGLASNIAASTLQHTAYQFSFPKQNRFHSQINLSQPTNLELPSQLGKRTTTQGFGNKMLYQFKWQEVQAKTLPSPDRYEVRRNPGVDKLKRSFGASYECYSKTYLPFNKV